MDEQKRLICQRLDRTVSELMRSLESLYGPGFLWSRYNILNQMKCSIQELAFMCRLMCSESIQKAEERPAHPPERILTEEELQAFDGRNGKPAYVAVKGIVYDVSDNATWAAATHFGLSAGKDLTEAFASCHPGQPVLEKLNVVGKLAR